MRETIMTPRVNLAMLNQQLHHRGPLAYHLYPSMKQS